MKRTVENISYFQGQGASIAYDIQFHARRRLKRFGFGEEGDGRGYDIL